MNYLDEPPEPSRLPGPKEARTEVINASLNDVKGFEKWDLSENLTTGDMNEVRVRNEHGGAGAEHSKVFPELSSIAEGCRGSMRSYSLSFASSYLYQSSVTSENIRTQFPSRPFAYDGKLSEFSRRVGESGVRVAYVDESPSSSSNDGIDSALKLFSSSIEDRNT